MPESPKFKIALNKAMAVCSKREYCLDDIRNKLSQWGIEYKDGEKILKLLEKENFINESRYAAAFVRDKFKYNKWGKIKIASQLHSRKLPSDVIAESMSVIENEQYVKTLHDLLKSHRRTVKAKNEYELKAKLLRYALSKGFESSLIYDVLNEAP